MQSQNKLQAWTAVHSFSISASFLQRQKYREKKKEGGMFINIYWPLLSSSSSLQRWTPRRASLPWMSKQQLVEGASGWGSGDSSRQQQMLASVERKCSLAKRRAAVWAESDNEGLAAYLLYCPWREVITVSMCVSVWRSRNVAIETRAGFITFCRLRQYDEFWYQYQNNMLCNT